MTEAIQFKTPEEELQFLRSKVLEQEKKLEGSDKEKFRNDVIADSIQERREAMPASLQTHPDVIRHKEEVMARAEDEQLGEMIAITRQKGVTHALAVLERLEDWKHEDDYHNYLVGLIREGLPAPKGAEKGPLYRALHMTLYEVVLPGGERSDSTNLKALISSMEQFYAGMISVSEVETLGKNYFVLEIANGNGSEEFVFYVSVPNEKASLFEKHLLSIFPFAKLIPREHDYNVYVEHGATRGSLARMSAPSAMPLKTFDKFEYDPLNVVLNSFSKIPKDGAGAAIQIVFNPQGDLYTARYQYAQKQIEAGEKAKDAIAERGIGAEIFHSITDAFFAKSVPEGEEKKVDTASLEHIKEKLSSAVVATNIRIVASAPNAREAESVLAEIESAFNQFENPGVQKFVWKRVNSAGFYRNFSFRLFAEDEVVPLNLREITSLLHFHTQNLSAGASQLKTVRSSDAPAPVDLPHEGTLLGVNRFQGRESKVYLSHEDRLRHFYAIGQTGTGKSTLLKNMIIQDIKNGDGVCMIDPHGVDIQDVLANIPPERASDVIYFDPAATERPMALNMLEYDRSRPEEKTFVVNELFSIFQKLYGGVPESMGPMFEQYFRNATMLVIEDPDSGSTLLDVSRVLSNKEFRQMKLSRCKNPVVAQFWREIAEKAGGEGALANIVPYITSKFDVFLANDIMRPIIAQERSSFNFREIMDTKKILLVNLSKGRLGDVNANLIGLILVGKILMAALSRVDAMSGNLPPFYLHIDEFQNVTTHSIATILSEARKYKLSLTMAHQFIAQLDEGIKNAVFGNVGSITAFRVGADDGEYLEKQFAPVFTAKDLTNIENRHAYVKLLVNGRPEKPFSIETLPAPHGNPDSIPTLIETSKLKFGRNRNEVEAEILAKYAPKAPAV